MSRMNWGRVRTEANMTRYGWFRAEETYQSTSKSKKKKKKRKRKDRIRQGSTDRVENERGALNNGREQRRLKHEALVRRQKKAAYKRKEARRLAHEARIAVARKAKAARKADPEYQVQKANRSLERYARRKARAMRQINARAVVLMRRIGGREFVVQPNASPTKGSD
jgi:hypothetical protein